MKWAAFFNSSVGKKFIMGLTGIFLILFLMVHAGINACIWAMDNGEMFNKAAHFMGSTVLIRILEVGLFIGFFIHIIQGLSLEWQNRAKRRKGYQVSMGNRESKWYSRSMGLLGTIILIFLIVHWKHFWVPGRFTGGFDEKIYNGVQVHDMYALMQQTFTSPGVVALYVIACISLCWHLIHGFQSAFRTIGVHNSRYLQLIHALGVGYSLVISTAFALMPISMHLGWVK